jgi:ketosteroid isomerase-like protein
MADSVAARFYTALAARDWRTMGALYADDARFSDPAFVDLDAREVRGMWRMLVARGTDLRVEHQVLNENADEAQVRWTATYTFSQTGRPVVNDVTAAMKLRAGKITEHLDVFDFHRWSRQALGTPGLLLGWTPFFQRTVQARARAGLRQFMQKLEQGRYQ